MPRYYPAGLLPGWDSPHLKEVLGTGGDVAHLAARRLANRYGPLGRGGGSSYHPRAAKAEHEAAVTAAHAAANRGMMTGTSRMSQGPSGWATIAKDPMATAEERASAERALSNLKPRSVDPTRVAERMASQLSRAGVRASEAPRYSAAM